MHWEEVELGQVAKFVNGDRGKNYPSRDSFIKKGIPFVNAGHLENYGIRNQKKCRKNKFAQKIKNFA